MRPRIKTLKHTFCSSSFGAKGIRSSVEEGIKRHVTTMEERERQLKDKLREAQNREKYAIKDGKIFIMTHYGKGMLGQDVLC